MFCQNCGNELNAGDKYCARCGRKVPGVSGVQMEPGQMVPPYPNSAQGTYVQGYSTEKPSKNHIDGGFFKRNAPMRELAASHEGRFWLIDMLLSLVYMIAPEILISVILSMVLSVVAVLSRDASALKLLTMEGTAGTVISLAMTAPILILTLLGWRFIEKKGLPSMGFVKKGAVKSYLVGLLIGFGTLAASWLIAFAAGSVDLVFEGISVEMLPLYIVIFIGFLIQGMEEEVICRGYLMNCLSLRYPVIAAIIINSVFFSALHLLNDGVSLLALLNLALFGIFASLYYYHTGNLWGIGAIHSMWNFTQGNIFGVLVSGMDVGPTCFSTTAIYGRELFNGGEFGLEGGLAVTIVETLTIVVVLLLIMRKRGKL